MEKWLKYFLSSLLISCVFFSCNQVKKLDAKVDETKLLMKRRHYPQCSIYRQELTSQLIKLNPNKAEYYQSKSTANTKIGDYHIAFPLLEKAYELDRKEVGYYYGWLLLYYYRDYDRAIQKLIEYDNLTPNQPDFAWGEHVNFLKGLCYKQMKQYENALREFNTVIELEGKHVDVYAFVYRGITKMKLNQTEEAILDFKKAIDNYPQNSMAYFYLGLSYQQLKNNTLAKEAYNRSYELLKKGFLHRDPYYEVFDAVSVEMVKDYSTNLN